MPLLELDVCEAEDDDTYPQSNDYESGFDEDDFDHTLTSVCSGLCGARVGRYCGCH